MPHVRLRGMTPQQVQELSLKLPKALAPVLETTIDNFTIELVTTEFFVGGQPQAGYPFCEVFWFERTDAHRKSCAQWLTQEISRLTKASDVAVVFFPIKKSDYFENGNHF